MSLKGDARYKLWKFFSDEHELTLTEGQLIDIVREVESYQKVDEEVLNIPVVINSEAAICRIKDYTKCPLFQNYKEGCHTCNFKRQTDL